MKPIPQWDEDQAAEFAEDMARATPEQLEAVARFWNWDGGISGPVKVIRHPRCDLATALRIYWKAHPEYYLTQPIPKSRKDVNVDSDHFDTFGLILEIERRIEAGLYKKAQIDFDPCAKIHSSGRSFSYVNRYVSKEKDFVRKLPGWAYQAVGPHAPKRPPGRPDPELEDRLAQIDRAARQAIGHMLLQADFRDLRGKGTKKAAPKPALTHTKALATIRRAKLGSATTRACELLCPGVCLIPEGSPKMNRSHFGGPAMLPPKTPWPTVDHRRFYADALKSERQAVKKYAKYSLEQLQLLFGSDYQELHERQQKRLATYQHRHKLLVVPLTLLAVIHLREIDPALLDLDLPRDGVLNFFYDRHTNPDGCRPEDREGWRVIYAANDAIQVPHPTDCDVDPPTGIRFEPIWTLPAPRLLWPDGSGQSFLKQYATVSQALRLNAPDAFNGHRIGGYPDSGDPRLICQLASHGINCIGGKDLAKLCTQKTPHANLNEWKFLLHLSPAQFPFDQSDWKDIGNGHPEFWIQKTNLVARQFNKSWCVAV